MKAKGTAIYARQHFRGPTLMQQSAIDLLAAGKNDTETAAALGLSRTCVTKWRLYDVAFQAALNRRRAEVWADGAEKLRALVPKALDALAAELDSDGPNRLKAALELLRLAKPPNVGPTDPNTIVDRIVTERRRIVRGQWDDMLDEDMGLPPFAEQGREAGRTGRLRYGPTGLVIRAASTHTDSMRRVAVRPANRMAKAVGRNRVTNPTLCGRPARAAKGWDMSNRSGGETSSSPAANTRPSKSVVLRLLGEWEEFVRRVSGSPLSKRDTYTAETLEKQLYDARISYSYTDDDPEAAGLDRYGVLATPCKPDDPSEPLTFVATKRWLSDLDDFRFGVEQNWPADTPAGQPHCPANSSLAHTGENGVNPFQAIDRWARAVCHDALTDLGNRLPSYPILGIRTENHRAQGDGLLRAASPLLVRAGVAFNNVETRLREVAAAVESMMGVDWWQGRRDDAAATWDRFCQGMQRCADATAAVLRLASAYLPDLPCQPAESATAPTWEELSQRLLALRPAAEVPPAPVTPPSPPPAPEVVLGGSQNEPTADRTTGLGEPSPDAFIAYRLLRLMGMKQTEIAEQLTELFRRPIAQGTVSRWCKEVARWLEAGNVLPDLPESSHRKPIPVDPAELDKGEDREHRAPRQRKRRTDR